MLNSYHLILTYLILEIFELCQPSIAIITIRWIINVYIVPHPTPQSTRPQKAQINPGVQVNPPKTAPSATVLGPTLARVCSAILPPQISQLLTRLTANLARLLSAHRSVCPSVYLSTCLFVCLLTCLCFQQGGKKLLTRWLSQRKAKAPSARQMPQNKGKKKEKKGKICDASAQGKGLVSARDFFFGTMGDSYLNNP